MSDERFEAGTHKNKAWKITVENTSLLSIISGKDEYIFKANLEWYLIEDWEDPFNRFIFMPTNHFRYHYPYLKVENEPSQD